MCQSALAFILINGAYFLRYIEVGTVLGAVIIPYIISKNSVLVDKMGIDTNDVLDAADPARVFAGAHNSAVWPQPQILPTLRVGWQCSHE